MIAGFFFKSTASGGTVNQPQNKLIDKPLGIRAAARHIYVYDNNLSRVLQNIAMAEKLTEIRGVKSQCSQHLSLSLPYDLSCIVFFSFLLMGVLLKQSPDK